MPTIGTPVFIARSMTLQIFSAATSDTLPPTTVKSCAKIATGRPSMRAKPVMTESPGIALLVDTEVSGAMEDEGVELLEAAGIGEEVNALAGSEFALVVLSLDASLTTTLGGLLLPPAQVIEPFLNRHAGLS